MEQNVAVVKPDATPSDTPPPTPAESEAARVDRMLAARHSRNRGYKVFVYRCTNSKCKDPKGNRAEDRVLYFETDVTPPQARNIINCWNCGNGFRIKDINQQLAEKRGMLPYRQETFDGELVALVDSKGEWLPVAPQPQPDKVAHIGGNNS